RSHFGAGYEAHFGASALGLGDVDLDGVGDYMISAPAYQGTDSLIAYSGATGAQIYSAQMTPGGNGGRQLLSLPDIDQDGVAEVLSVSRGWLQSDQEPIVSVFAGASGQLLFSVPQIHPGIADVYDMRAEMIGDLNQDGFDDFALYLDSTNQGDNLVRVVSTASSQVLQMLEADNYPPFGRLLSVQVIQDQDGDGSRDLLVVFRTALSGPPYAKDRVVFISSATGASLGERIFDLNADSITASLYGKDVDGDGLPEILFKQRQSNGGGGLLRMVGTDGSGISLREQSFAGDLLVADARYDVNGDLEPDLFVRFGPSQWSLFGSKWLDGLDFTEITELTFGASFLPTTSPVTPVGDISGDGTISFVVHNDEYSTISTPPHQGAAEVMTGFGSIGQMYCASLANSTGQAAELCGFGWPQVAENWLGLSVVGLPANSFGYFLVAPQQGLVPLPGGSQGNLCLGGAIGRFNQLEDICAWGATSSAGLIIDLTSIARPTGPVAAQVGDTWNFQFWYRDGATSNFSNGLETTW
ncbi:MAG: hypothetical protein R3E96_07270, partial [Planctomycetota bacterium]